MMKYRIYPLIGSTLLLSFSLTAAIAQGDVATSSKAALLALEEASKIADTKEEPNKIPKKVRRLVAIPKEPTPLYATIKVSNEKKSGENEEEEKNEKRERIAHKEGHRKIEVRKLPPHSQPLPQLNVPAERERALSQDRIVQQPSAPQEEQIQASTPEKEESREITLTIEDLQANPKLLLSLITEALESNEVETLRILYPIYRSLPESEQDPFLIRYIAALILTEDQHIKEAILLYRELIAQYPHMKSMQFRLAQLLFIDRQFKESEALFEEIAKDETLPEPVQVETSRFLSALKAQQKASYTLGANLIKDDNLNGGSYETLGNWRVAEPVGDSGISYHLSATKDLNLKGNHYLRFSASAYGQQYFKERDYNELTTRLYFGYGYQDYQQSLFITPFFEQRWYSGKRYSNGPGVQVNYQRVLTDRLRLSTFGEYQRKIYDEERSLLDADAYAAGATLIYSPSRDQFFFGGMNWNRELTQTARNSYTRIGGRAGWGKQWGYNISTNLQAGYSIREYDGSYAPGFGPFDVIPKDKEFSATFGIWKRDWEIMGINPRLNISYQKTDSNLFINKNNRTRIYLDITKDF